ncbi:DEAD/DEAH box helicase [Nocardia sp. NPDC003963]
MLSLTLDENGKLFKDSVTLSSCAWAVGRTVGTPGPDADDWLDGFEAEEKRILHVLFDIGDGRVRIDSSGSVESRGSRAARLIAGLGARVAIDVATGGITALPGLIGSAVESHLGNNAATIAESMAGSVSADAVSSLEARRDRIGQNPDEGEEASTSEDTGASAQEALGRKSLELVDLVALTRWVSEQLGVDETLEPDDIWIKPYQVSLRHADEVSSDELINSFYAEDLNRVADELLSGNAGQAVLDYLASDVTAESFQRLDVREDPARVLQDLHPAVTPDGRWPGRPDRPLVSSQQFAINNIMRKLSAPDARGLYAVNGPPGTGKTTLLRDLIAAIVVQRAEVLAGLPDPRSAFRPDSEAVKWQDPEKPQYHRRIVPLIEELTGFEIVIASSNNGAVENITLEVPTEASIDTESFPDADYLSGAATLLAGEPCWGAVAARLGKRPNRVGFVERFWWGKEQGLHPTLREYIDGSNSAAERKCSWREAKQRYREAVAEVERLRTEREAVADLYQMCTGEDDILTDLRAGVTAWRSECGLLETRRDELRGSLAAHNDAHSRNLAAVADRRGALATVEVTVRRAEGQLTLAEERCRHHAGERPAWWKRLFVRAADQQWQRDHTAYQEAVRQSGEGVQATWSEQEEREIALSTAVEQAALSEERTAIARQQVQDCERELQRGEAKTAEAENMVQTRVMELQHAAAELEQKRLRRPGHVPGPEWTAAPEDRSAMETREQTAPWMDPEFARARSEVLLSALDLHRATLFAEPDLVWRNMRAVTDIIRGDAPNNLPEDTLLAGWQMLFFVVPAVSTTFASLPTMFAGVGRESIGWLVIDEAGQATPQAAVGGLWRSRRAVIVGDPRQLEPVVTLPMPGQKLLANHFDVDIRWAPQSTSVQSLADRVTPLGTWLPGLDELENIWIGSPLRVHRRCDQLMFEVSNAIAYDGMMVNGVNDRTTFPLARNNLWIDIPAPADGRKWNPEEGKQLVSVLEKLYARISESMIEELARIREESTDPDRLPAWAQDPQQQQTEARRRLADSIFIVSPFREVVTETSRYLRKNNFTIPPSRCGTIHTTQGKEADIVIMILGTATDQRRARSWAAATPNLLNVAITRARRCLIVIGDYENWSKLRNFAELTEHNGGLLQRWSPSAELEVEGAERIDQQEDA